MLVLENDCIGLHIAEDYSSVSLRDRRRGTVWQLHTATVTYRREPEGPAEPLRDARVSRKGDAIVATFALPEGAIEYEWSLGGDMSMSD